MPPVEGWPATVTSTSTTPAAWAPVVHVNDVGPTTVTDVHATPPTVTVAPAANPVPVIVTDVPPPVGPLAGEIPDTVGAGVDVYVNRPVPPVATSVP